MLSIIEKIILSLLVIITVGAFFLPVYRRYQIIRSAKAVERTNNLGRRFWRVLSWVFLQRCTLKNERLGTGIIHAGLFYAALTFDTMTVNHTLDGFLSGFSLFGHGLAEHVVSGLIDFMALVVLLAAIYLALRRFLLRPQALRTSALDSAIIYFFLLTTTLSYLFFEACRYLYQPEHLRFSFLGPFLSRFFFGAEAPANQPPSLLHLSWWLHIVIVYAFIAYVPHSKYFHMFAGPFNLLFHRETSPGEIEPINLENTEVYGIEKALDLTWKDCLDAFACIECGRCQDVCPAYLSGKPLSPKMIIYNLERHLLRSYFPLHEKNREKLPAIVPEVIKPDELWTCTTCGACMHVCPVEIEHLAKIFGLRQAQVLMESQFPTELNSFFRHLETNANPWGIGFSRRGEWAEKEKVPRLTENPEAEWLFFVGCAGSFDELGQAISRAMVRLLRQAGMNFAILAEEEKCCGDAARRLGNEYLFQMLARQNLELFLQYGIKKILVFCPHGYHTLKYEYPRLLSIFSDMSAGDKEFLSQIQVVSHLELLSLLVKQGKISFKAGARETVVTFHDSCYYARHHHLVAEPRYLLRSLPGVRLKELPRGKEHSFCCGAGGGLMWTEEKLGQRINHIRAQEIAATQAQAVITACPFCLTMMRDGLKDLGKEELAAFELTQFLAASLLE